MKALLVLASLLAASAQAGTLSLEAYLDQVRQANPQLRSQRSQDIAYSLAAKEPLVAYSPQLKAQAQRVGDQREPMIAFSPEATYANGWGLGLSKLFGTGTYVGLDYAGGYTDLVFPAGSFVSASPSYDHSFGVTLSQPLWRNFMASEVEAARLQAEASAEAQRAGNRYAAQAVLFQARQTYLQLQATRQVTAIQAESLERNQKILEWTKSKYADNLADRVDVLQVEAALRQVDLGLRGAREAEAKLATQFNSLRGQAPGAPVEDLGVLAEPASLPAAKAERPDIAAAQAALRASDAFVESVEQRFTPDVSVFASLAVTGRDPELGPAASEAFGGLHPNNVVGVKMTANLDFSLMKEVLAGAERAKGAGEAGLADKQAGYARDWADLRAQWDSLQQKLALARELEGVQREKAEREKVRYRDGRTTNFQVLRFEDDYNLSRIQTLQLSALAGVLEGQARFYNGDDQPW